jgi:long-chain acyl-CoA synthetase
MATRENQNVNSRLANQVLPAGDESHAEFWELKRHHKMVAAIDARSGAQWSYSALSEDAARIEAALPHSGRKSLGLLIAQNRYECLAAYLAALNARSSLMLLDAGLNAVLLRDLVAAYRPDWIFSLQLKTDFPGYHKSASEPGLFEADDPEEIAIHPDLAVLLTTSGSTGSPKLVRLTLQNLASNARSIAQFLQLTPYGRPVTSLPMAYSYGLSVINSHLYVGATIVFTEHGVLRREFWDAIDQYGCTSFAGVPYTYQLLLQTGLLRNKGSTLRVLTQAGGRLEERSVRQVHELALDRGWKFFVMYGQTEATARISYLPFEQLSLKIGSVGIAVPQGSLAVDEHTGELTYCGPNVMLGYAECRGDLAKGDELNGVLRTGDLARVDADGYLYITGRLNRFLKLFGKRFNLDDAETILSRGLKSAVACYGRDDLLIAAVENCESPEAIGATVCEMFDLPRTVVRVLAVTALPRTASGKLDHSRLPNTDRELTMAVTP